MLSKKNRFHGRNSLRYVYSNGSTVRNQTLALKYHPNQRRDTYRMAVVVSKKTAKSAVVRNRIRRRIYAAAAELLSDSALPYDLVFTVFSDAMEKSPQESLKNDVAALLKRAGILSPKPQHSTISEHDKIKGKE